MGRERGGPAIPIAIASFLTAFIGASLHDAGNPRSLHQPGAILVHAEGPFTRLADDRESLDGTRVAYSEVGGSLALVWAVESRAVS